MEEIKNVHLALDFCRYLADKNRPTQMSDSEKKLANTAAQNLITYLNSQKEKDNEH